MAIIYSSQGNLTFRLFFGSSVDLTLETDQRISLRIPDSYRESTLESHQLMILLEGTQCDLFQLIQPFESRAVLDFVRTFFPDTNSSTSRCNIASAAELTLSPAGSTCCTSRCNIASAAELTLSPAGGNLLFPTLLPSFTTQHPGDAVSTLANRISK